MTVVQLRKKQKTTTLDLYELFLQDLLQAGKSPNTISCYRSDLKHFKAWLPTQLEDLTGDQLRYYFATLSDLSTITRARKHATLQSLFRWAVRHDKLVTNLMDKVDVIKRPENLPRPMEETTVKKIFDAIPKANVRDRLLFTLLLETGMRVSEALGIYVEDLNRTRDSEMILIRNGKGGKSRNVPLYTAVNTLKLLDKHLKQSGISSGALFRGRSGSNEPISYQGVNYLWRGYCEKAGVTAQIHALRHTYATDLIQRSVNVVVVKKLLGHANLQTTMQYTEVDDQLVKSELISKLRR